MEADLSIEEDIYQKLDTDKKEIRLLTLKRSTWSSYSYLVNSSWFWLIEELHYTFVSWFNTDKSLPIECQLETVESDEAPPYIALSYVREDPSETSTIFVNGKSVQVTTNLAAALRRIRRRYWDPETLWIDAICINQKDDVEKSSQVNLMRDVYTNARGVYIWLGDEEGDFSTAMKQCRCLTITSNTFYGLPSATQQALAEQGGMNRVPEAIEPIARLIFGRMEKRWMALHNLLSRPYWTRVWILQEFVLSRDALILCGGRAMSLDLLAEATAAWPSSMHMENRISQKLTSYTGHLGTEHYANGDADLTEDPIVFRYYTMTKARRGGELLELVIAAQDFASSNPLNRVYGLLGILPAEKAYLQPDYSRKTSQLYIDLIAEGLKISNSLGYISTGGIGHRSHGVEDLEILISKLPSWVPDFKQPVRPVYLRHPAVPHIPEFQASAESQADYQFLSKNRILEAKGFICDKIRKISLPFVDDYITSIDDRHDFLEGSTEISEQMLRNAMQSLKNYIETIDPDNHAYPLESISWRQALFRSILLHEGHVNAYEDGKFHCNTCSEQYGEKSLGYMLLLADIGYAELATPAESGSTDIPLLQVQDLLWRYFVSTPNFSEPCPALAPDFVGGTLDTDRAAECKKSLALALSGPATANTSFFVIVNGFYGISDASVQQGDDICILLGCPVPLLVRRLELDWVVVGDCYVFGMTYGEMTEKVVSGELKLDTFRFR